MDITEKISKGLFRQYRGMRLLLELLQKEYSQMQEAENSEELAKHELSIQELIRQLLKEREEMHFWITSLSSPESGISDIIHMFPEENRKELGAILKELDILEASCNKQAEKNADMAMALVEQSNNTPMRLQNGEDNKNESGIEPAFEKDQQKNLFLGLGKLMVALKNNNQKDVSKFLGYVDSAIQQVSERLADVGARTNRVESAENMLSELKTNQKERKSKIEDVDFANLMSQISRQKTVYQAILKSSSMIMRESLVNYI